MLIDSGAACRQAQMLGGLLNFGGGASKRRAMQYRELFGSSSSNAIEPLAYEIVLGYLEDYN